MHRRTHQFPQTSNVASRWLIAIAMLIALGLGHSVSAQVVAPAEDLTQEAEAVGGAVGIAKPTAQDGVVARVVATLMPQNHISSTKLNDTISERALNLFIDSLDPLKLYFYQADIEDFQKNKTKIDDMVRVGDLSLAYEIFGKFTRRVEERVTDAQDLLSGEFDFDKDETIIVDPESAKYATNRAEARDRWRRQIKYALLDLKDDGKEGSEATDQLRRRYSRYARRWKETSSDDILEMYLSAVTMGYDPHSTYMSPSTLTDFTIQMRLNLEGIGAALREKDGSTVVTSVIPGGAADQHGKLKPDDVIVSVGQGEDGELVDIVEMPLKEVVTLIRGKAGTLVRLGVKPGGVGTAEELKIVRARVELAESAARGEVIDHVLPDETGTKKIGYIKLPSFYLDMQAAKLQKRDYRSSTRDVRRILIDFKEKGVDGVVLDLSRNGGGSLTEAINLTGLFIDRGPVVQVKNSDGSVQQYADEDGGTTWDGPLVVMSSKFSASASEIFAGAIKDYGRGIVVGDPATHGKGTVQTLMDLGQQLFRNTRQNLGALKVTLQQFYLPDGESTQRHGVAADIVLPSITQKMDVAEGDLKFALKHDRVKAADHDEYDMVPPDLLGQLRKNSQDRVSKDDEFIDLLRRVDMYVKQKEQDTVSLDETTFMKRRKDLDAQKQEEEVVIDEEANHDVIFRDYYYNREVINIAHEYIEGLKKQGLAKAG